jgi:hypothetical protein
VVLVAPASALQFRYLGVQMPWIIRILVFAAAPIAGLFVARDTLNFDILQTMIAILLIIGVPIFGGPGPLLGPFSWTWMRPAGGVVCVFNPRVLRFFQFPNLILGTYAPRTLKR